VLLLSKIGLMKIGVRAQISVTRVGRAQEKNGLPLQATKGKPPESLSALREHHPPPIEISSVASASVPRLASQGERSPANGK
jgi:hypothetical protein